MSPLALMFPLAVIFVKTKSPSKIALLDASDNVTLSEKRQTRPLQSSSNSESTTKDIIYTKVSAEFMNLSHGVWEGCLQ